MRRFEGRRLRPDEYVIDFDSLEALAERLLRLSEHYRQIGQPFERSPMRADVGHVSPRSGRCRAPGATASVFA